MERSAVRSSVGVLDARADAELSTVVVVVVASVLTAAACVVHQGPRPRARPIPSLRASRAHTASFSSRPLQAAPSAPASATLSMYRRNPEARPL